MSELYPPLLPDEFTLPQDWVYLDGNSLGLHSRSAQRAIDEAIANWRDLAILGWTEGNEPWFAMSRKISTLLAPIIGAESRDIMIGESTTVNLHQILTTYYKPSASKRKILIDSLSFPTDRYAVVSHLKLKDMDPDRDLCVLRSENGLTLDEDELIARLDDSIAMAVLPSVIFTSGQLLNISRITEVARQRGIRIAWDCSHSAGIYPHRFREEGVELAFGCTYKYLNGGPGAVGWLYVSSDLQSELPGMCGWFGSDPNRQFAMTEKFEPALDASRFMMGTPHILSLAPLLGSLQKINQIGISNIRECSLNMTRQLRELIESRLKVFGVEVVTPSTDEGRGGHIACRHAEARLLSRTLRENKVIVDFRLPDVLRFAPSPLYNSYRDIKTAVDIFEKVLAQKGYLLLDHRDELVT